LQDGSFLSSTRLADRGQDCEAAGTAPRETGERRQTMKPYYEHAGITIYHGDARELVSTITAESIITDPVWPNSVFPNVTNPEGLLEETLLKLTTSEPKIPRIVIHLGIDSDPRFLDAVPDCWPFFRICWLEYAIPGHKGRILYSGDVAYIFGTPPRAKPGAMVLPGKIISTKSDPGFKRHSGRNGRNKNYTRTGASELLSHPAPRRLQHVRWLCKWFAGASVLDPFAGTGTTGLACKCLQIPCTLIEIEEKYCEIAATRLSQEVLDLC
jgi:hypothetical protein